MLARIARELFWLGRDLTRAEHTARVLDGAFHADVTGAPGERGLALSWEGVQTIIGAKPPAPGEEEAPDPRGAPAPGRARGEIARALTLDTGSPASVVSCVARARERGGTLRDVISTEMWEALNSFYLSLGRYDTGRTALAEPYSFYQEVKQRCALFWGLLARTMLRDEGRAFLEAGGRTEEADMVLRMLRVALPAEPLTSGYEAQALALLHAVGGLQAYRRAVRLAPTFDSVVRFLLYEGFYPGSVAFSLHALREALAAADPQPRSSAPVLRLGRLIADLELQRRTTVAATTQETLARIQDELQLVDRDIDERYFALAAFAAVHL